MTTRTTQVPKQLALEEAIARINERCSRDVASLGITGNPLELLSTGITELDAVLGSSPNAKKRGIPRKAITEIVGPKSSGKTWIAFRAIAAAQKKGLICAFLDLGLSFSEQEAAFAGVDVAKLVVANPMSTEEALSVIQALFESNALDVCVIDAFGSISPQAIGRSKRSDLPSKASKSSLIVETVKNIQILAARHDVAAVITRRMNPTISTPAAGDAAIRKAANVSIELLGQLGSDANGISARVRKLSGIELADPKGVLIKRQTS